jgi:chorismate-pyruvate lyase
VNPDPRLIYPLSEFYEQLGLPLPAVTLVNGRDIPEPYRTLLFHDRDMTPTLERAHDRSIHLRVLRRTLAGNVLSRQVVLVPEGSSVPVAFGAIKIHLEHFPDEAKPMVLAGKEPLGAILRSQGIAHAGHPEVYLQVTADALIHRARAQGTCPIVRPAKYACRCRGANAGASDRHPAAPERKFKFREES